MHTPPPAFPRRPTLSGLALLALLALPLAGMGAEKAAPASPKTKPVVVDASTYPNLQAALDAVPASGGLVRLPPGDFELDRPLILTNGETRIEGAGPSTHLINRNTNGEPALIIRPADRAQNKRSRLWRVQVENLRISGNPKSGDGLLLEGVDEPLLLALSVDHNGGDGIHLVDCTEDPRISNSIVTYNRKAGLNIVTTHDVVVSGNQFEENQDAVRCIDSYNLTMTGNNIDDHLRHGLVMENTYGSVVSGNMIEECEGTGIILDRGCYGVTISANVITHHLGGGVDLRHAWGCTISANTFVLTQPFGLRIGPASGRLTVTGNNFCNSYVGGRTKLAAQHATPMSRDGGGGVELNGTSDIVISGNSFTGLNAEAVRGEGETRRIVITGNVMSNLHRRGTGKGPAIALGRTTASIVKDNAIEAGFESP